MFPTDLFEHHETKNLIISLYKSDVSPFCVNSKNGCYQLVIKNANIRLQSPRRLNSL